MRSVVYLMNTSLDGFVEGPDGKFDWTTPDEEVFRFHIDVARDMSAFLYGRRIYETMAAWQTMEGDLTLPEPMREYARIWKSKPKIVFSTTLRNVGPGCTLAQGDVTAEVAALKRQPGGPMGVCGPGLASAFARQDLIDEYWLVVYPIVVGSGKTYFPGLDH
ncbi:MAG TPA: dihydrofolate reductase family protein, partial [Spirochaetia bacterium]|nr:dihydrofolate reductase family protein [Spirochaetia bacterium]